MSLCRKWLAIGVACFSCVAASARDRVWTRTTRQYKMKSVALLADLDGDGERKFLGVNLGGQVRVWSQERDEGFIETRDFLRAGDRREWHTGWDVRAFQRHRRKMAQLTLALRSQ